MENQYVVKVLNNIADILEMQGVEFKPQAYRRAAQEIEVLQESIEDICVRNELEDISGVGKHIAAKIKELVETGKLKYYKKLKKSTKIDIEALNEIPSLGPKKIKVLYAKLKIKNVKDLAKALRKKKLRELSGFGRKTEEMLLKGIHVLKTKPKRFPYETVIPVVRKIKTYLTKHPKVTQVAVAGSFRRKKSTVGDVDFVIVSTRPKDVMDHFVSYKDVDDIIVKGPTRGSVRLQNGLQVDCRIVKTKEFGSALLYFSGGKQHNIELRKIALRQGYTLSEYGLYTLQEKKWVAGKTEKDIYTQLGLRYIPPRERLGMKEFVKYKNKK
ncbi:hypothetical protein HOL21_02990 [Candidatus Woesearchaeota archaeon]|jgi:DNA polymerase (family X)|nr:hypothetical protein [Candidatus Woesearchaeota archaeon]MBT5397153.1 hypothetical protein [Candidatus Woesearchaeota archaeon]MBT5924135.1 DNA polymerase III [Candidatus Woesearchaeota archaeon]MBT6367301.1 hypothetical protein [Candidatus Woesearchaeota archaeon]MBT7762553.1 hypothetical protein [Candidatus Woesearchaeota archaeon]